MCRGDAALIGNQRIIAGDLVDRNVSSVGREG
jgi:hypothetical protein